MFGLFGQRQSAELSEFGEGHRRRRSSESASQQAFHRKSGGEDRRRASAASTQASSVKRYAMYDLVWPAPEEEFPHHRSMDSALAARKKSPSATRFPQSLPPPPKRKTSAIIARKRRSPVSQIATDTSTPSSRDDQDELRMSSRVGITVTKVEVVEYHSATDDELQLPSPRQGPPNNDKTIDPRSRMSTWVANVSSSMSANHRHSYSDSDINPPSSFRKSRASLAKEPRSQPQSGDSNTKASRDPELQKGRVEEVKLQQKQKKRNSTGASKGKGKRRSRTVHAVQPDVYGSSGWQTEEERPKNHPPHDFRKLKRTGATIHRRQRGQNLPPLVELAPVSNPPFSNDPTDLEDDLAPLPLYDQRFPWVPEPLHPPQLIHATLVPLPNRKTRAQVTKRNSSSNRSSQLISCNPQAIARIISANPKRLSRTGSLRRRGSIIIGGKRSSVLLRRQLLEDSVMMSLLGGPQAPTRGTSLLVGQPINKPIIRRRTKKGSNAVLEDREARRERKRKEKKERRRQEKLAAEQAEASDGTGKPEKILEVTRIVNNQQLVKKVEESRKIENLFSPLPPPRRTPNDYSPAKNLQVNTSMPLASSGNRTADQSSVKSAANGESLSEERPPLPVHQNQFTTLTDNDPSKSGVDSKLVEGQTEIGNSMMKNEIISTVTVNEPSLASKRHKSALSLLGIFNSKSTRDTVSGLASPPVRSPLSSPIYGSPITPPPQTPLPQLPPTSPTSPAQKSRSSKRQRRPTVNGPPFPILSPEEEKLKKMQEFEALIADTEKGTPKKTRKKRAQTTAIFTTTTTTTAVTSANGITTELRMRGKDARIPPVPPLIHAGGSGRRSEESNSASNAPKDRAQRVWDSRSSSDTNDTSSDQTTEDRGSLALSVTESVSESITDSVVSYTVHYRPEEHQELSKGRLGEDGVIRVTLTPSVCR